MAARSSILALILTWLLSAAYLGWTINKSWDPTDVGTLGQAAERVLHGEMPQRDFVDSYTGGLAYLDALIFKFFGVNSFFLRIFLFLAFLAWIPCYFSLAREFLTPWPAAGATLVAVAWSVPNYAEAMPTWFCLFLATFATLALARYIRTPSPLWLLIAGFSSGLSFLIKSIALYYVAAALLFFVYREQSLSRQSSSQSRRTLLHLVFLTFCLVIFIFALIKLVFPSGGEAEYLHFVFPGTVIATLLILRERTPPTVSDSTRFRLLFGMAAPFLFAAAAPVCLFFLFYWYHHALTDLIYGLFIAPFHRLNYAQRTPGGILLEYPSVLAALLFIETAKLRGSPRRFLSTVLVAFAAIVLFGANTSGLLRVTAFAAAMGIIPVLTVAALPILSRYPQEKLGERFAPGQLLILLLAVAAIFSLVQFPYAHLVYFGYVAPLIVLIAACLISKFARPPRAVIFTTIIFFMLFGVFIARPRFMTIPGRPDFESTPLLLSRAGPLHVSKNDASLYQTLIPFVQSHAGGNTIIAAPDCPEVYFLSGLTNPTPVLFDLLTDAQQYQRDMKSIIERSDFVKVVVINNNPYFSGEYLRILKPLVLPHFPYSQEIGRFTVYWRP